MHPENPLDHYISKFANLRVDRNRSKYTAGRAPHKPILLLSLITLRQCGRADLSDIRIEEDLLELWSELWSCLTYDHTGPIYLPLYHLRSDGFWNLRYRTEQRPPQVRSISGFNQTVRSVSMDPELSELIEQDDSRNQLLNALLNGGYFSNTEINNLKQKITEMITSFEYEEKLNEQIEQEFKKEDTPDDTILQPSRDPAFRRLVLKNYAGTCAVCGARPITSGIYATNSTQIEPLACIHNDHVWNGMALA